MTFGTGTFGSGTFGSLVWQPGDPWPSATEGGAAADAWGGYVRLWITAAIAAGQPWTMGPHANAKLNDGNVMGGSGVIADPDGEDLWVDLTCDAVTVDIAGGAGSAQGIFSKSDAATLTVKLADPTGKYDPLNPASVFSIGGHSRLIPSVPVRAFAEVVNGDDGTVTRHNLFTGTADSWGEDWTPNPGEREAILVATDDIKRFVRFDRPEQPPVGTGDNVQQRVQRIVDYFGWIGPLEHAASSTVTLDATTLAQPAWEQLNRTVDDELGYIYVTQDGALRWTNRAEWNVLDEPVLTLGCDPLAGVTVHDVLTDASPANVDLQIRNSVYAARSGGTSQHATSSASVAKYGEYDYQRTDLGLQTDPQAAQWATAVVQLYAFPQYGLEDVTFQPAVSPRAWEVWPPAFDIRYVSDVARIIWRPHDRPQHAMDVRCRVVGARHQISLHEWQLEWQLVVANAAQFTGAVFTVGPHTNDKLDAGFILA